MTVKRVLFKIFDELPERKISGWEIFDLMHRHTGKNTYPTTLLGYARAYADIAGADFECVDPARSLYLYRPGLKIGDAILEGIE